MKDLRVALAALDNTIAQSRKLITLLEKRETKLAEGSNPTINTRRLAEELDSWRQNS